MRTAATDCRALSQHSALRPGFFRVRVRGRACVCAIGSVVAVRGSREQLGPPNAWKRGLGGNERGFEDAGEGRKLRRLCGAGG